MRIVGQTLLRVVSEVVATAAAGITLLAAPVAFDDRGHRQVDQRPHVGGQHAVAARHQHDVVVRADVRHDLLDARIAGARMVLDALEHPDLLGCVERCDRIVGAIERRLRSRRDLCRDTCAAAALARNRARGDRRFVQRIDRNVIRVGECGLVAGHGAHADALFDVEAAALDDAFFQRERFAARVLEVKVGEVGTMLEDRREHFLQAGFVESVRVEQQPLGGRQAVESGIGRLHREQESWAGAQCIGCRQTYITR